ETCTVSLTLDLGSRAPFDASIEVNRAVLNRCAEPVIARAREITVRAVTESAGLSWDAIDEVLLVGGQTLMPAVQQDVEQLTVKKPHVSERPQRAIALGAGEYGRILNLGEEKFHQNTLTNVLALPIGVRLRDNEFHQLVKANQAVPYKSEPPHFVSNAKDN